MIIVQLTDLHVRPHGKAAYRLAETNMLTERALRAVRDLRPRPDCVVISGDLTDNGLVSEYAVLAEMLKRLIDVPVFVVPGNHDRRAELRDVLAHLPGVTADPVYIQYAIDEWPVRLVMLDTLVPAGSHGLLLPDQLDWLDSTLAEAPNKPTILVMHHPPFACGLKHMDGINLRNAEAFTAVIARHAQVKRILCGHHHRPIVAPVAHAIGSIAPSVAHQVELDLTEDAPAFWNLEPAAYQIHLTESDGSIVSHMAYVEAFPGPFPFLGDPDYPGRAH